MATTQITLHVRFAWWLKPYMCGVIVLAFLTRRPPDMERVVQRISRALKIEAV